MQGVTRKCVTRNKWLRYYQSLNVNSLWIKFFNILSINIPNIVYNGSSYLPKTLEIACLLF